MNPNTATEYRNLPLNVLIPSKTILRSESLLKVSAFMEVLSL